jgi:hypothetical protein
MQHVPTTGGIERFDDLHIDEINAAWSPRSQWVSGMAESLFAARRGCSTDAPDKVIAVMFSLGDGPAETPTNLDALAAQLDWTPPSLYLFEAGKEPWIDLRSTDKLLRLPLDCFSALEASQIFLYEWHKVGRAEAMRGDKAAARKAYQDFLTLWKDADPDIPIYQQAKVEYAKLQQVQHLFLFP